MGNLKRDLEKLRYYTEASRYKEVVDRAIESVEILEHITDFVDQAPERKEAIERAVMAEFADYLEAIGVDEIQGEENGALTVCPVKDLIDNFFDHREAVRAFENS